LPNAESRHVYPLALPQSPFPDVGRPVGVGEETEDDFLEFEEHKVVVLVTVTGIVVVVVESGREAVQVAVEV
jgi:hypothetical protein